MTKMPLVGDELAGYRLMAVLARGGMSIVYQAENPRIGSVVVVKVLAPEVAADDVFRARFLQESRIAASLDHPNVVPIYDMGAHDDLLFIAMRYVSGGDLRGILKSRHHLAPSEALPILQQTARALDHAHRHGLVHRDVKPGNILIQRGVHGDPDHVYLADFGISKLALSRTGLTGTGQFLGTLDYIAPEQIRGKAIDSRADIYSLGCVFYQMLTGRVPFEKEADAAILWAHVEEMPPSPSHVQHDLPRALDDVIYRALAKDPADRYGNALEFVSAAQAVMGETSIRPKSVLDESPADHQPSSLDSQAVRAGSGASLGTSTPDPPSVPDGDGGGRRRLLMLGAIGVVLAAIVAAGVWKFAGDDQTPSGDMAMPGTLMHTLEAVNQRSFSKGLLPPESCEVVSATTVHCGGFTAQGTEIDSVDFQSFGDDLQALYGAYVTKVEEFSGTPFKANAAKCNRNNLDNGETAWNHDFHHPDVYSIDDMVNGDLNATTEAAGRLFCMSDNRLNIVWTQNDGAILAVMTGGPHEDAYSWWKHVHHEILGQTEEEAGVVDNHSGM